MVPSRSVKGQDRYAGHLIREIRGPSPPCSSSGIYTSGLLAPDINAPLALSTVGSSDKDWQSKVSRKIDATSGYTRISFSLVTDVPAVVKYTTSDGCVIDGRAQHNSSCFAWNPLTLSSASYRTIALSRYNGKINSKRGNMQLLAPLAELNELRGTVRSATSVGMTFLTGLADLRRGRFKSSFRAFQDLWLTYSFGISPLVATVNDVNASISKFLDEKRDEVHRFSAGSPKFGRNALLAVMSGLKLGPGNMRAEHWFEGTISYQFIGGYRGDLRCGNNYGVLDHFGLGLDSLPATLWELTTLSWVVDYFTNVGDFLEDTFFVPPANSIYMVENKIVSGRYSIKYFPYNMPKGFYRISSTETGETQYDVYAISRTKLSSHPRPSLRLRTVDEIGNFGVTKLLNLAGVLKTSS